MKAENTRRMLTLIAMKTGLDVNECLKEITEFEEKADVGRATEKAFEGIYAELLIHDIWPSGDNKGTERIASVAELLEWATQEGKAGEGTDGIQLRPVR